ncbi:MAG TPA: alpha/beta fold hydrolase [Steroidobacter sp.]|uniref:YheT family hydrolase n=1 Tax=Steroidobacter sp. TaxID=1978227 RepID=UPI002EDA44F0
MIDSAAALDSADIATFAPSGWLANAHFQSIVPSLSLRRPFVARRAKQMLAVADTQIVDCGDGVRLLGHYSSQAAAGRPPARDLAILLHGWEGSSDSVYVLSLGSHLFDLGCDIFRLNFRDHGPSHHLNEDIFHSCRLDEVIGAVRSIQRSLPDKRITVAGFSLGGNFALRVAAKGPRVGIELERAVAVCPVLRPHSTMEVLETGWFIYQQYFINKWKRSLRRKQQCFPKLHDFKEILAQTTIRSMTEMLVSKYSEFTNLDAYLNGYAITGDALAHLTVPSHILISLDDPIIPAHDLQNLARSPNLHVTSIPKGGHCGFMDTFNGASWADRQIANIMFKQRSDLPQSAAA